MTIMPGPKSMSDFEEEGKSRQLSRSGEESPKPTPYKIDTGPIPLDTLAVSPDGKGECWYRIPSWRVYFDHEALKGVDMRLHRAIASDGVWTLTEASTGLKVFGDLAHDFYVGDEGAMLAEFASSRMLQITPEKLADALAKGREKLRQHTPNPFNAAASENSAHEACELERRLQWADAYFKRIQTFAGNSTRTASRDITDWASDMIAVKALAMEGLDKVQGK